jgi:hypothetical protein
VLRDTTWRALLEPAWCAGRPFPLAKCFGGTTRLRKNDDGPPLHAKVAAAVAKEVRSSIRRV